MAKVTESTIQTTLVDIIAEPLMRGLALTQGDKLTTHDQEFVLNWAEGVQKDAISQVSGAPRTAEFQEKLQTLADAVNGLKFPSITDDGALVFVDSESFLEEALAEAKEICLTCTDADCPLSLPNRSKTEFPPN